MKRSATLVLRALATVILLVAASIVFVIYVPDKLLWAAKIHEGDKLVARIESYHQQQGRLPESFEDLGMSVSESDKYFYEKCNIDQYIVWFGTTLGRSMTYSSSTREWTALNIVCNRESDPPAK